MGDWLLSRASEWTWAFLRDAPFRPREETITESILTEFHRHGGYTMVVEKSTANEEAARGLDWAWAIETTAGWLNLLVQAKQIDGKKLGYYQELRKPGASSQAAKLIHAAAMYDAVPVYVLYNSEVPPFGSIGTGVSFGACINGVIERQPAAVGYPWDGVSGLGVTLVHAEDVVQFVLPAPYTNQRALHVNKFAMPWECLFCPAWEVAAAPTEPQPGVGSRIGVLAQELGRRRSRDYRERGRPDGAHALDAPPWLTEEMPEWAAAISEGLNVAVLEEAPRARYFVITGMQRG